jgi:hypothetical protein
MQKSRLITFGCSYTYGQGLPDCVGGILTHTLKPSQLGWAKQVATSLDMELINKSIPGSSNLEILYSILEFDFEPSDTVVVMWSHYLRDVIFTRWFNTLFRKRLGLWKKTPTARKWIEQMSEQDYAMKSWIYMHHSGLYLEKNNITYIHYPSSPYELEKYPAPVELNNLYVDGVVSIDKALDGMHPGLASNKIMADRIAKILKENQNVVKTPHYHTGLDTRAK